MKKRQVARIVIFLAVTALLALPAGTVSAMEITVDEHHSPSEDLVSTGEYGILPDEAYSPAVPVLVQTPEVREAADYSSRWIGTWTLPDDPDTVLTITPGSDEGEVHMEAGFYRMCFIEDDIKAMDDRLVFFGDYDLSGSLEMEDDGSVILAARPSRNQGEDDPFASFFLNRLFVFTKDGRPAGTDPDAENRWASKALIDLEGRVTDSFLPDEKYVKGEGDDFTFSADGQISSWTHEETTGYGRRSIQRSATDTLVYEYDGEGRELRELRYANGIIDRMQEYAYNPDGQIAFCHSVSYSHDNWYQDWKCYDYDASGRLARVRYTDWNGNSGTLERYEYAEDGSSRKIVTSKSEDYTDSGAVAWYDRYGNLLRQKSWLNGSVVSDYVHEYVLDENGKVIRDVSHYVYDSDFASIVSDSVTETRYSASGRTERTTTTTNDSSLESVYLYDDSGTTSCHYEKHEYSGGGTYPVYVYEREYDIGPNGGIIGNRTYEYGTDGEVRKPLQILFYTDRGDRGTIRGLHPFPSSEGPAADTFSIEDLKDSLRYMTRDDVSRLPYVRQVSDCMYDSTAPVELYGRNGTLRFIFGGGMSNRLQGIWWICRDRDTRAGDLYTELREAGIEWNDFSGSGAWNMLGIRTWEGAMDGGKAVLTDASYREDTVLCAAFTFRWDEPEEGAVMPWQRGEYTPYRAGSSPAAAVPEAILPGPPVDTPRSRQERSFPHQVLQTIPYGLRSHR